MGQVLKMIATDSGRLADMISWTLQTGHEMFESLKDISTFSYSVFFTEGDDRSLIVLKLFIA